MIGSSLAVHFAGDRSHYLIVSAILPEAQIGYVETSSRAPQVHS